MADLQKLTNQAIDLHTKLVDLFHQIPRGVTRNRMERLKHMAYKRAMRRLSTEARATETAGVTYRSS